MNPNQLEILSEQTKDAINLIQLLEVELSSNQEDPHILRTVTIVEKMLQEHLSTLQHQSTHYS